MLLDAVGIDDVDELFEQIPPHHRRRGAELPPALALGGRAEAASSRPARRNDDLRARPQLPRRRLWQHHVPAICDEIAAAQRVPHPGLGHAVLRPRPQPGLVRVREPARRAGRNGLRGLPVYSWGCAAGTRCGWRRGSPAATEVLVPALDRPGAARGHPHLLRLPALAARSTSARWTPTPRPAGSTSTTSGEALAAHRRRLLREPRPSSARSRPTPPRSQQLARAAGAETIVGVDPISLGVLAPPGAYGADIVVGTPSRSAST